MLTASKESRLPLPLVGLLTVQLLSGIILTPIGSFFSIYLNEILLYPIQQVARVIALGQGVGMLAALLGGSLSDSWGHKWVLTLGIALVTVSCLLYLLSLPWLVTVLWAVSSAGMSLSALGGQGYLTLAAKATHLGISSAFYNWGYTVGGAVGAPIAALILGDDAFVRLGWALLGLGLSTTIISAFLPRLNNAPQARARDVFAKGYMALLRQRQIFLLALLRFLPTCYYGVMTLIPLILKQQSDSNTLVALFVASSSIFASVTQLFAGWAADRWGERLPTVSAFSVILLAIAGTILTWQSVWGLYLFGALGVGAAWALSTVLPGLVKRSAEPEVHGRIFGMLHLLWTLAMILGTLLGGALLDIDLRLPFVIVGLLNIFALLLTVPFFNAQSVATQD